MAVGVAVSVSKVAVYSRMTEVNSFYARVVADGGTISDFSALRLAVIDYKAVQSLEPSLYTFASGRKAGVQYSLIPADGSGDLSVTRSGDTAMELNANGFWQPVAANLPRYDYVSGRPMLNVEELRTNLLPRYKSFAHSDWTKSGASIQGDPNNLGNNIVINGTFNAGVGDFSSIRCSLLWNALQYCTCTQNSGGSNTFAILQSSTTTIGKLYRIRFRAKAPVTTEKPSLNTSHFSNISYISQPNLSTDWQNYDFYATASTTSIIIYLVTNSVADGTIVDIDDIVVNEMFGYASPFVDSSGNNLMSGYKLVEDTSNGVHRISTTTTIISGTTHTFYGFAKKYEKSKVVLDVFANATPFPQVQGRYNLLTGESSYVILGGTPTSIATSMIPYVDDWWLCSLTVNLGEYTSWRGIFYNCNDSYSTSYLGDGTSGILIAHAQLEAGATASSPIGGAEGSTQTRNADVIVKTGASALIGQTEGTIIVTFEYKKLPGNNYNYLLTLYKDNDNYIFIRKEYATSKLTARVRVAGVNFWTYLDINPVVGLNKIAIAYKNGDSAIVLNGSVIYTNADAGAMPSLDTIWMGHFNSQTQFNDQIKLTHLGKTRISNEKLIELTTL